MVIPMQSHNEYYFKNHLNGTNVSVKLGTVAICIRIGIGIGPLYKIIPNSVGVGVGVGIGVGQWKLTIKPLVGATTLNMSVNKTASSSTGWNHSFSTVKGL